MWNSQGEGRCDRAPLRPRMQEWTVVGARLTNGADRAPDGYGGGRRGAIDFKAILGSVSHGRADRPSPTAPCRFRTGRRSTPAVSVLADAFSERFVAVAVTAIRSWTARSIAVAASLIVLSALAPGGAVASTILDRAARSLAADPVYVDPRRRRRSRRRRSGGSSARLRPRTAGPFYLRGPPGGPPNRRGGAP